MRSLRLVHLIPLTVIIIVLASSIIYHFTTKGSKDDKKQTNGAVQIVSPAAARDMLEKHKNDSSWHIIDVRTPEEYSQKKIQKAVNIDVQSPNFKTEMEKFNKTDNLIIYCRTGTRSTSASDALKKDGFKHIYNMKSGIEGWIQQDFPYVKY